MKYYYGLDNLRALLMILGVFIHAATFVSAAGVNLDQNLVSYPITYLEMFFSLFRMECFFILSGFLSCMLIKNKGVSYFIENRKKRVLIPFISSYFLFIFIPSLINFNIDIQLIFNVKHLWFLLSLMILSIIFVKTKIFISVVNLKLNYNFLFFISLIFMLWFIFLGVSQKIDISSHYINFFIKNFILNPLYYGIFYLIGIVLFSLDNLKKIIENRNGIFFIAIFSAIFSIYFFIIKYIFMDISTFQQIAKTCFDFISGIALSLILFICFMRLDQNNKFINHMKNSSLVVYVSHPIILYTLKPFFYEKLVGVNVYLFYFSLCLVTIFLCNIIYLFFLRFSVFRYMFGMK